MTLITFNCVKTEVGVGGLYRRHRGLCLQYNHC